MAYMYRWGFNRLVKLVVSTLLNKYDLFMIVEGNTGIGKSSFSLNLALSVKKEFRKLKRLDYKTIKYYYEFLSMEAKGISYEDFLETVSELIEKNGYNFRIKRNIIYRKEDMQNFLNGWFGICISDEMINVAFNRDFYQEDQKNIVKMINMFRDHFNFTIACVPNFNDLDKQIKNLCKMRISVVRRGIAIIQTPNKTFYGRDKWDTDYNEKIERNWLMKKTKNPKYTKLTTFRGIIKFPKLSPKVEDKYQQVKNDKRNIIVKNDMGIEVKENISIEDKVVNRLIKGGVKNMQIIEGVALANDLTPDQLKGRIRSKLNAKGMNPSLSSYFWNKKKVSKHKDDEDYKEMIKEINKKL